MEGKVAHRQCRVRVAAGKVCAKVCACVVVAQWGEGGCGRGVGGGSGVGEEGAVGQG